MTEEGSATDPLLGDPRVAEYLGPAWTAVSGFDALLRREGVIRGLVGPRELQRLWERHLLNSAAAARFLPTAGTVIDLGSGAGLPGVVLAGMRPDLQFVLLEPMLRRTKWLEEAIADLRLANTRVLRARAEDVAGSVTGDAVTSRAVASLDKLYGWTAPLLRPGGELIALKGARAAEEIREGAAVGERLGFAPARVDDAFTIDGVEPTRVVRARWKGRRVR